MHEIDIYEILVRENEQMLYSYVLSIVRDPALAEDVCQEAFIQGYRKLDALRKNESYPCWIRAIARNIALAELRRANQERPTEPEVLQGMEDVFAALDGPQGRGESWEERASVAKACLESLPEKLRDCSVLFYSQNMDTKSIASRLGASLSAVLKRLERARTAIARCVERRLGLGEA